MQPIVSIIIPYYNYGDVIQETVDSLLKIIDLSIHEVIIINDGSTDDASVKKINAIAAEHPFIVIHQENMGLAKTRNKGLELSNGKYFLPLDADNLLTDLYLTLGVEYLESNPEFSAVYGRSKCFDEGEGFLPTTSPSFQAMSMQNYVDACALFRKSDLLSTKGYDFNMPVQGYEDWELWLRFFAEGKKIHYIPTGIAQHYRVRNTSMIRSHSKKERGLIYDYLANKHPYYINYKAVDDYYFSKFQQASLGWVTKLFIKKYFPKLYQKLIDKEKISKYL